MAANRPNSASGFTLVEMLVVIGIILVIMVIGTYSYQGFEKNMRLARGARTVEAAITYARSEAMKRGKPVALWFVRPQGVTRPTVMPNGDVIDGGEFIYDGPCRMMLTDANGIEDIKVFDMPKNIGWLPNNRLWGRGGIANVWYSKFAGFNFGREHNVFAHQRIGHCVMGLYVYPDGSCKEYGFTGLKGGSWGSGSGTSSPQNWCVQNAWPWQFMKNLRIYNFEDEPNWCYGNPSAWEDGDFKPPYRRSFFAATNSSYKYLGRGWEDPEYQRGGGRNNDLTGGIKPRVYDHNAAGYNAAFSMQKSILASLENTGNGFYVEKVPFYLVMINYQTGLCRVVKGDPAKHFAPVIDLDGSSVTTRF